MSLERKPVRGTTPQDIANMDSLWFKVFGNLSIGDVDQQFLDKLNTQYTPIQGEGNLDSTHPLYIRFYIPPNVKKLNKAPINIILSRYRMDSDVALGGGGVVGGEIAISTSSQNVTASLSTSPQATSTYPVDKWGGRLPNGVDVYVDQPLSWFDSDEAYSSNGLQMEGIDPNGDYVAGVPITRHNDGTLFSDLFMLGHIHKIVIPGHTHSFSIQPHSHSGVARFDIPEHLHNLNEGIKESSKSPSGVVVYINDKAVTNSLSGDGQTVTELDIVDNLIIGSWNVIKVVCTDVSRVTLYGIIELVNEFKFKR